MRKFILYFLLILFFAGVATFSYGFLNGKKIRIFASQISEIQAKYDLAPQVEKIEAGFRENGKKEISRIRDESRQFSSELDGIVQKAEAAKMEISVLDSPKTAKKTKQEVLGYYEKLALQSGELKGIIDYMSQIIDVAAVFGQMQENASLDEVKNIIARAKEKGNAVETGILPEDLRQDAQNLKDSMNAFLLEMEELAALKSEDTAALDASYNDFSRKEDEFFSAAKKHIDGMEDPDMTEKNINSEIERLKGVRFSLR